MKTTLSIFFDRISNIGIYQELPYLEKLRIKLLNRGALITLIISIYYLLGRIIRHFYEMGPIENYSPIFGIFGVLTIWKLNSLQKFQYSKYFITFIIPIFLFISYIYYGNVIKVDLAFLALLLVNLLFYKSVSQRFYQFCYILGLHFSGILYLKNYGALKVLGNDDYFVFDPMIMIIGIAFIIIGSVSFLYQEAQYNYQEQLKLNLQLSKQNEELQSLIAKNENKNQLFGIIAHDLKEPGLAFHNLTKRLSYLLKNEPPEQIIEVAEHFENAGNKMFYTLDNLLNWSISQKEGIQQNPKKLNLFKFVNEVADQFEDIANQKKVIVINHVHENDFGFCDKNILSIILGNIIHNSVKFSNPKSEVVITSGEYQNNSMLVIQDFGKGIRKKVLAKINRGEIISTSGTLKENGYGLGLKSCFSLIEQMNGKIIIESEKGNGTIFKIVFPKPKLKKKKRAQLEMV